MSKNTSPPLVNRNSKPNSAAAAAAAADTAAPPAVNRASKLSSPAVAAAKLRLAAKAAEESAPPIVERRTKPIRPVFFHTVNLAYNSVSSLIAKFEEGGKNINSTLVEVGSNAAIAEGLPRINIYANTRYAGFPSIVFDDDIWMMAHWPANINSSAYNFSVKPNLSDVERVFDMAAWQGNVAERQGINTYRPKFSQGTAVAKIREIYERISSRSMAKETGYSDDRGRPIIDRRNKFQSPAYTKKHAGSREIEIPQGELRHNESHIRASLSNISSIALVKDYNLGNISDLIELLQIKHLQQQLVEKKRAALEKPELFAKEMAFVASKSTNLFKVIGCLLEKLELYKTDLANVEGKKSGDGKTYKFNDDLTNAFERKKRKDINFVDNANSRREWLTRNMAKLEQEMHSLQAEMNENYKLTESDIRIKLSKEVSLTRYDKSASTLVAASENAHSSADLLGRMMEIFNRTKQPDILHKLVLGQADPTVIMNFLINIGQAEAGRQLGFIGADRLTVFEAAARNGSAEIAQFIFEQNMRFGMRFGMATNVDNALLLAIQNDHFEMTEFLLAKSRLTPQGLMQEAIRSDAKHVVAAIFSKALDGVAASPRNPRSLPPFFENGFEYIKQSLKEGKFDLALILVNTLGQRIKEAELAAPRADTFTTAEEAARKNLLVEFVKAGNLPAVEFMLNHKMIAFGKDKFEPKIMTLAAHHKGSKMVDCLLSHGISSADPGDHPTALSILEERSKAIPHSAEAAERMGGYLDVQEALAAAAPSVRRRGGAQPLQDPAANKGKGGLSIIDRQSKITH